MSAPCYNPIARGFALVDGAVSECMEAAGRAGYRSPCGSGCSHCCYEPAYAEKGEVEFLIEELRASGCIEEIRRRTEAWWTDFFAHGLHRLGPPTPADFRGLMAYRAARLPCPALVEGLCLAYDSRPIGCRTHVALGARSRCSDDRKRPRQSFLQIPRSLMQQALGEFCQDAPRAMFQFDHLGIWLGNLLLGKTDRSAAAHDFIVDQTDHVLSAGNQVCRRE